MLLETLSAAGAADVVERVIDLAPTPLFASIVQDIDRLLVGVEASKRDLIAYRLEYFVDRRQAAGRAAAIVRRAAAAFKSPPPTQESADA
jgi:hypothetical protein